jgi:DNA-3-methyladenine glycosylase
MGQAVLLRALRLEGPVEGLRPAAARDRCRGPARLTRTLGIDGAFNGEDLLTSPRAWIEPRPAGRLGPVGTSARIGVDHPSRRESAQWPLRYFIIGEPCVSGPRGKG